MKLLIHSNAPWASTGYGNQVGLFAPYLKNNHEVGISSFYGLEGSPIVWEGIPVMPGLGGEYGNGYLVDHAKRVFGGEPRAGLVFTLIDVWVLNPDMASKLRMASWVPVDHEPAPPQVVRFFEKSGSVPVAMSRFGEGELTAAGLEPLYCPHGVNTDVFAPLDQRAVRKELGAPLDAFLVGIVAANKGAPSRKAFQEALMAFRALSERDDDAYLYLHTVANPDHAVGEDLPALISALGLNPERVSFGDQYRQMLDPVPDFSMAKVYSAFDVLLNASKGEGFGIPVLEAQACGVPAIVTNFSAMPEVCGAGWHVACRPSWTRQNSFQVLPDVDDMVEALRACRALPNAERARLSERARTHAMGYSAPRVLEGHMLPALEQAAERVGLAPRRVRAA